MGWGLREEAGGPCPLQDPHPSSVLSCLQLLPAARGSEKLPETPPTACRDLGPLPSAGRAGTDTLSWPQPPAYPKALLPPHAPHPAASLTVLPSRQRPPGTGSPAQDPWVQLPAPHTPHLQPQRPAPARPSRGCCSHAAGSLLQGVPHGHSAQPQPAGRRAQGRHRGAHSPQPAATSAPAPRSRSAGRPWQLGLLLDVASSGGTSGSFITSHPHRHGRAQPSCTHTGAQMHTHGDAHTQTRLAVPMAERAPMAERVPLATKPPRALQPGGGERGRFASQRLRAPRRRELGLLASHFTAKWGSLSLQTPCPRDPGAP